MKELVLNSVSEIKSGKWSCIVINDGEVVKKQLSRGVKPILDMLAEDCLQNSCVVDKVVGRAAAFVMVYGGIRYCYAINISEGAAKVFCEFGVEFEYENISPFIVNRKGDGVCPMEQAVKDITLPKEAVAAIRQRLAELSEK